MLSSVAASVESNTTSTTLRREPILLVGYAIDDNAKVTSCVDYSNCRREDCYLRDGDLLQLLFRSEPHDLRLTGVQTYSRLILIHVATSVTQVANTSTVAAASSANIVAYT